MHPAATLFVRSVPPTSLCTPLTPAGTRTPEPVVAAGVWQASSTQAKITWEASEDAELARYEVRGAPGAEYLAEDEILVGTVLPADPRELLTAFSLGAPGTTASFKVYVG